MKVIQINQAPDNVGKAVTVRGWVHNLRDMGKIAFIDLRDASGLLQAVAKSEKLPKLSLEYVVEIKGTLKERGEKFANPKLETGGVELAIEEIEVLNVAKEMPFNLHADTRQVNDEIRLKYRYLDLRTERMQANLRLRHQATRAARAFLDQLDFVEVETPLLTKGTPEGAREFLVPSRLHPEEFYVLPQSPQQFKQLLMVASLGRYYQFARCLRDEDQRGDRQPEFTQLDIEMSFVEQEDVLQLNEEMMKQLVKAVAPDKKLSQDPFPRLTYAEAMDRYKSDKPDLRKNKDDPDELAFAWITDFPMFEKDESGKIAAMHHPFTAPRSEDALDLAKDPFAAKAIAYDLVLNGSEVAGGSIRIHDSKLQHQVFELLGLDEATIQKRFGHILEAFMYGVPPHGGIAYGWDRLIMILAGEPNIREVMAFPKTGDARDPLMGSPTAMPASALEEAHIQTKPKKPSRG